jgi:hypothetical protein
VLYARINVIIDNEGLETAQGGTRRLHLSDDVNAIAIGHYHFAHSANLTLDSGQSGISFSLGFLSHCPHLIPHRGIIERLIYTPYGYQVNIIGWVLE